MRERERVRERERERERARYRVSACIVLKKNCVNFQYLQWNGSKILWEKNTVFPQHLVVIFSGIDELVEPVVQHNFPRVWRLIARLTNRFRVTLSMAIFQTDLVCSQSVRCEVGSIDRFVNPSVRPYLHCILMK